VASRVLTLKPSPSLNLTPLFDAHLEPDHHSPTDLRTLASFGLRGALLTASEPDAPADADAWLAHFAERSGEQAQRLRTAGIRPFVALGVTPTRAPTRDLERVLELLPETRGAARVVAIGRIGLGDGSPRAEQLLLRQLELAQRLDLPAVVELSDADRARQTRRALALVKDSGHGAERILVVGASLDELNLVLGCGHFAALAARSAQVAGSVAAVAHWGPTQLLLGSASFSGPSDLLGLSRTASALLDSGLSAPVLRRVVAGNALALLRIDPEALEG
jgi:predicted metal-dependent TIM-barrel fold hydrolase